MEKITPEDVTVTLAHWGGVPYSVEVATPREALMIYITPTGLIRIREKPRKLKKQK